MIINSSGFGILGIILFILWLYLEFKNSKKWQRILAGVLCIPMLLIGFDGINYVALEYQKDFSIKNLKTISKLIHEDKSDIAKHEIDKYLNMIENSNQNISPQVLFYSLDSIKEID